MSDAPLTRLYNLGKLSQAGDEVEIAASEAECGAIARWADLQAVGDWRAKVSLQKLSPTRFSLRALLESDLEQACVVTLGRVAAHIERSFARELLFTGVPRRAAAEPEAVEILADEGPDEIENLHYDLAGPLLEEFSLALDPYPRAPGVEFEPLRDSAAQDTPQSPFSVLGRLKLGR